MSRLGGATRLVQNDGPFVGEAAFTPEELQALAQCAELRYVKVATHFGYRLTLAGEKVMKAEVVVIGEARPEAPRPSD